MLLLQIVLEAGDGKAKESLLHSETYVADSAILSLILWERAEGGKNKPPVGLANKKKNRLGGSFFC
jgi:hypothetical protein